MSQSIRVIHERELDAGPAAVGSLLDSLASEDDRLWPTARWPAIHFDRPLGVGARGGHGPVRYEVSEYEPGRRVSFCFDPRMFLGRHLFEVTAQNGRTTLRHVTEGQPRGWLRVAWPLLLGRLHEAAVEDCLDRAEAQLRGVAWRPRPLHGLVGLLQVLSRMYPDHSKAS